MQSVADLQGCTGAFDLRRSQHPLPGKSFMDLSASRLFSWNVDQRRKSLSIVQLRPRHIRIAMPLAC